MQLEALPPQLLLGIVVALCLFGASLATWRASDIPVPGVRIIAADGDGLAIGGVRAPPSEALGAHRGARIAAFLDIDGHPVAATADLLWEEPDVVGSYAAYNDFLARQERLAAALEAGGLELMLEDGQHLFVPAARRSPTTLPPGFWMQVSFGLVGGILGGAIWAFRPREVATRLYALTGVGFAGAAMSAAVYSTRELALAASSFYALNLINALSTLIFAAALVGLLWHYPRPLGRAPVFRGALAVAAAFWVAHALQLADKVLVGPQSAILVLFLPCFWLAWRQWRRHARDPVSRATLQWFFLSVFSGTVLFAVLVLAPPLFGRLPLAEQSLMLGVLLIVYLGIAAAVTRYRLFDIERWWFNALLWFLGGAAVVVLDVALLLTLPMAGITATLAAVAIVGWLYFPARQWLWRHLLRRRDTDAEAVLRRFVTQSVRAQGSHALPEMWRQLLADTFQPLQLRPAETPVERPRIVDHGQAMELPGSAYFPAMRAVHPARGTRLFAREDLKLAKALISLAMHQGEAVVANESGVENERQRIMRDLHDDLGSKLLVIAHSGTEGTRAIARSALQDVRDILQALDAGPTTLQALSDECRWELQSRAEAHGFSLHFERGDIAQDIALTAREATNIARVVREAVTNAVRHTRLQHLRVVWRFDGDLLSIDLYNDGCMNDPGQWSAGRGLRTMRGRMSDLGGAVDWTAEGRECRVALRLQPAAARRGNPCVQGDGGRAAGS